MPNDIKARRNRLTDVRFMADTGESLTGAARRLGIKPNTLEAFLYDHDRDVLATLRAREPRDPNQRPGLEAMRTRRRAG
jgi:hypothetical protein